MGLVVVADGACVWASAGYEFLRIARRAASDAAPGCPDGRADPRRPACWRVFPQEMIHKALRKPMPAEIIRRVLRERAAYFESKTPKQTNELQPYKICTLL